MLEEKATKYVAEPAPLLCPVCKKVFIEPIISVKCGHTFCKRCIEKLVSAGSRCPIDRQVCDSGQLVLNLAILGQLADLKIYCCYGLKQPIDSSSSHTHGDVELEQDPDGCPEKITLGQRNEHEDSCMFAWSECPIAGSACGPLRKKDVQQHMEVCLFVPCAYSDFGCKFTGGKAEVSDHKSVCSFKDESQLMAALMKELKQVKSSHEELQKSLAQSTKVVEKLALERITMVTQLEQQALTITALSSRMDKFETDLEGVKSVRVQRAGSNLQRGEGTPRYSRRERHTHNDGNHKRWSTESSASMASYHYGMAGHRSGPFQWQMPFTVKCIGTFRGHEGTIWSLVTHGGQLYSGSSDGSIKVWDIVDLRRGCLKTILAHNCTPCMTIGNGILYSSGTDMFVRTWHLDSLEEIGSIENAHESMMASAMTCSNDYLFTSSIGCIKVWDAITLKEVHRMEGFSQSWVRALNYNKRKNLLYSSSSNKIYIWKCLEDFSLVESLETQHGAVYSLATTKQYIITGTHSQNIQVYDITTLQHLHTLSGHIGRVTVLCVVDSGDYMFSGSSDSTVTVWNLDNMLPILTLQRHEKAVHSLAVWNDSVFTGSEDMEIKVFRHFKL